MLEQLYIENIAVIEKQSLAFSAGFNLLTGETGAGKSIIIDALHAVLGERTSRELIRTGAKRGVVSATFGGITGRLAQRIAELGYAPEADGTLLLQRIMTADGKNICRVGGQPATVSVLKEIGRFLINIHGQHDSSALLNSDSHYRYIDVLAGNGEIRRGYAAALAEYKQVVKALRALETDAAELARRAEYLAFQVEELEAMAPVPGEKEQLLEERKVLQSGQQILEALAAVYARLAGGEDVPGALELVQGAAEDAGKAAVLLPDLAGKADRLTALGFELESVTDEIRSALEGADFSPDRQAQVEERLELYFQLERKYGVPADELSGLLESAKAQQLDLNQYDQRKQELEEALDGAKERLIDAAALLTESRKTAGEAFAQAVCRELEFLNMPGVRFVVSVEPASYAKTGADRVEFLISANVGEPPKPLARIASGGELSRIMLAIKCVLAGKDAVPTLIFDEIDTGISGNAAEKVGRKLRQVSEGRQVICITHLAQIAALAHRHLYIEKQTENHRTVTSVTPLEGEARVAEIARLLAGGQLTDALRATAQELLARADAAP